MDMERAKEMAGDILNTAQALFNRDKCLYTVLFSIDKDERITPVSVSLEEQNNMLYISELLKDLARVPETEVVVILMDTHFNYFKQGEEVYKNLESTPGASTALTALVHVRGGQSAMRQLIYVKDVDSIMFSGEPWIDNVTFEGDLGKNPF